MKKNVNVRTLRKQLMSKIDVKDLKEVEKVERYCQLVELIQKCQKEVDEEGPKITIINGSQTFVKSHPLLNEIAKFNSQLIALERTMIFKLKTEIDQLPPPPPGPSPRTDDDKDKRGGLI